MMNKTISVAAAIVAAATMSGLTVQPAAARYDDQSNQYRDNDQSNQYGDGYRAGYHAGYYTARHRGRYDDRLPQFGNPDNDPNQRWHQRYSQAYTYNDDGYYRECRKSSDPGGVLAGALIGGLLGNSVGRGGGRGGATVAGVIIGGALGAGLTRHLDCEDRSYAYRTYYDGFNSGHPQSDWQWENTNSGNYGDFRVGNYYNDPDGFRCATYTQQIYVNDSPEESNGRACQQPDGTWVIVS